MSDTLARVQALVALRLVRVSNYAYEELLNDAIRPRDAFRGLPAAKVVEEYPDYFLGPCVLVLQADRQNRPLHVLWGMPKGQQGPAVLITAHRPNPALWSDDYLKRKKL
jgi:hypothetical protein